MPRPSSEWTSYSSVQKNKKNKKQKKKRSDIQLNVFENP